MKMKDYALVIQKLKPKSEKPEKRGRYIAIFLSHGKNYVDTPVYDKAFGWLCCEDELVMWGELPELILPETEDEINV